MSYTVVSWQRLDKCTNALFQTTPIYPYSCDPCMCLFEPALDFEVLRETKTAVVNFSIQDHPGAPIYPESQTVTVGGHLQYNFGKPTGFNKLCLASVAMPFPFYAGRMTVGSPWPIDPTVSSIIPMGTNPGKWATSNTEHSDGFSTYINTPVSILTLSYLGETLFSSTLSITRKVYGYTDPSNVDTIIYTDGAGMIPSPTDSIKMFPVLSYTTIHSISDANDAAGTPINYPDDLVAGTIYNARLQPYSQLISFTVAADKNGVVDHDTWFMSGLVYDGPIDPTVDAVFDVNIDSLTPWGMYPGQFIVSGWGYNGADFYSSFPTTVGNVVLWYARHRLS